MVFNSHLFNTSIIQKHINFFSKFLKYFRGSRRTKARIGLHMQFLNLKISFSISALKDLCSRILLSGY